MSKQISAIYESNLYIISLCRKSVHNVKKISINLMGISRMGFGSARLSARLIGMRFKACLLNGVMIKRKSNSRSNIEIMLI